MSGIDEVLSSTGNPLLLTTKASSRHYYKFEIPKEKKVRGKKVTVGVRQITAPKDDLKKLQTQLMRELRAYNVGVHDAAHAYRHARNINTMALPHVKKRRRLRLDLENFFPSVTEKMVLRALPKTVPRDLVIRIKNWCFLDGVLPQGAPSSPLLSNIALYGLDVRLAGLAKKWRLYSRADLPKELPDRKVRFPAITYSRYCDDIVFSSNYVYLEELIHSIVGIIESYGLKVNPKKTHCASNSSRQCVTGIVVNEKLSVQRSTRKLLRAELHNLILDTANGKCPAMGRLNEDGDVVPLNIKNPDMPFCILQGQVAFVTSVCAEQGAPLKRQLDILIDVHTQPAERWSEGTIAYINKHADE